MKRFVLNRRTVLRGLGAGLALPALDAMMDDRGRFVRVARAASVPPPVRFVGFRISNGPPKTYWTPVRRSDTDWDLPAGARAFANLKPDINFITGLHQKGLRSVFAHTDGCMGCFIGYPIHSRPFDARAEAGSGPSLEWFLGKSLRDRPDAAAYPALSLSLPRHNPIETDRFGTRGKCCWYGDTEPATFLSTPQMLVEKLFPANVDGARTQTMLDFFRADAARMTKALGAADKARVDQHLTSIREIERSLESLAKRSAACAQNPVAAPAAAQPTDDEAMPLMAKLVGHAFRCDLTRYVILDVANARPLPGHEGVMHDHTVSHVSNSPDNLTYVDIKMKHWVMLLDELKASREGERDILYNSVSLLGCDVAVGYKHNFDDIPMIQAGQGGGLIKTGRQLQYPNVTWNNLLHSTVQTCGVAVKTFGVDGTGPLPALGG